MQFLFFATGPRKLRAKDEGSGGDTATSGVIGSVLELVGQVSASSREQVAVKTSTQNEM